MQNTIELADGRILSYATHGGKGQLPLVWLHGTPGCLVPPPGLLAACGEYSVPLITLSRSGYGDSARRIGRCVVDDVDDVKALVERLDYKQCVVGGWSGGGPHALACAARLPNCIAAISIACIAPYDAEGLDWLAGQGEDNIEEAEAALKGEAYMQEYYKPQREAMLKQTATEMIDMLSSLFPQVDRDAILSNKVMGDFLEDSIKIGMRYSSDGAIDDSLAFCAPWGFDLSEIKVPVIIYHGSLDKMCPFAHGQWIGAHIPHQNLTLHLVEGEGHISLFVGKEKHILEELNGLVNGALLNQ